MDNRLIYPIMIMVINAAIMIVLMTSFRRHFKGRDSDVNFHSRMLLLCTCLLLANTFAFMTALYGYFILKSFSPEIINFGRFADRYCMFFAYIALEKLDER